MSGAGVVLDAKSEVNVVRDAKSGFGVARDEKSDAGVVHNAKSGFGVDRDEKSEVRRHCHRIKIEEAFMQIDVSFMRDGSLGQLKGSRLSAFIAAGLHEAEILLGDAEPFSLRDFIAETQWSKPSLKDALDYLVEHHFLVELPGRGRDRAKQYRVAAYMRFGKSRRQAPSSGAGSPSPISKNSLLISKNILLMGESKKFSPDDVDVQSSFSDEEKQHQTSDTGAARRIFASARINGKPLQRLAQTVAPALAERWARWIAWAEEYACADYSNPRGLAVYLLSDDPAAEPPDDVPAEAPEDAPVHPGGEGAPRYAQTCEGIVTDANDAWHAVLAELQHQMTRATFDTWVRSTRALGYEGETLVVQVASEYAKEWLENRLAVMVERTLGGVVGKEIAIRYEANPRMGR